MRGGREEDGQRIEKEGLEMIGSKLREPTERTNGVYGHSNLSNNGHSS